MEKEVRRGQKGFVEESGIVEDTVPSVEQFIDLIFNVSTNSENVFRQLKKLLDTDLRKLNRLVKRPLRQAINCVKSSENFEINLKYISLEKKVLQKDSYDLYFNGNSLNQIFENFIFAILQSDQQDARMVVGWFIEESLEKNDKEVGILNSINFLSTTSPDDDVRNTAGYLLEIFNVIDARYFSLFKDRNDVTSWVESDAAEKVQLQNEKLKAKLKVLQRVFSVETRQHMPGRLSKDIIEAGSSIDIKPTVSMEVSNGYENKFDRLVMRLVYEGVTYIRENGSNIENPGEVQKGKVSFLLPDNKYRLIFYDRGIDFLNNLNQESVSDSREEVRIALLRYLEERGAITSSEMNCLLVFLKPEIIDTSEQVLEQERQLALSGFYPIEDGRPITVLFDSSHEKERVLTDASFKEIHFFKKDKKITVTLQWGEKSYSFVLDKNLKMLNSIGIDENNLSWILRLTYGYMKAMRNRDEYKVYRSVDTETGGDIQKEREPYGGGTHLRVMTPGHYPTNWETDESENNIIAEREFQYSIRDMNRIFLNIQGIDTDEGVERYLSTIEVGLANIVRRLFERKRMKDEFRFDSKLSTERWDVVREQVITVFASEEDESFIDEDLLDYNFSLVTLVKRPSKSALTVTCSDIADELFADKEE